MRRKKTYVFCSYSQCKTDDSCAHVRIIAGCDISTHIFDVGSTLSFGLSSVSKARHFCSSALKKCSPQRCYTAWVTCKQFHVRKDLRSNAHRGIAQRKGLRHVAPGLSPLCSASSSLGWTRRESERSIGCTRPRLRR